MKWSSVTTSETCTKDPHASHADLSSGLEQCGHPKSTGPPAEYESCLRRLWYYRVAVDAFSQSRSERDAGRPQCLQNQLRLGPIGHDL